MRSPSNPWADRAPATIRSASDLAKTLRGGAEEGPTWLRLATITAITPTVYAYMDGELANSAVLCTVARTYRPKINDRVVLAYLNGEYTVLFAVKDNLASGRIGAVVTATHGYNSAVSDVNPITGSGTGGVGWTRREDVGGFGTPATPTVTANPITTPAPGRYSMTLSVRAAAAGTGRTFLEIKSSAAPLVTGMPQFWRQSLDVGEDSGDLGISVPIAAASVISARFFHTRGGAADTTVAACLSVYLDD